MVSKRRKIGKTIILSWSVNDMSCIFFLYTFLLCTSFLCCSAKDSITSYSLLSDDPRGNTLVSSGQRFELGFFTPNGSSDNRRYVGIWYYGLSPQTIVWVANRDSPLSDTGGVFAITDDGNLKVLDKSGKTYWSTSIERSSSMNRIAMILDTGNLVLSNGEQHNNSVTILWQSFENPTDTFLPGMKLDENLVLASWKSYDDPAAGNFTFQQDQERTNQVMILKRSVKYWRSGISGKFIGLNEMPSAILYLLSNFTSTIVHNDSVPYLTSSLYTQTRLVMSLSGQIHYFLLDTQKVWSLIWAVPRDKCSVFNACGNYGSCNSKNDLICKCLPGFKPTSPENWNGGDYSGGCARKSITCGNHAEDDAFLDLEMMKVGDPDSQFNAKNEMECKIECLNNCQCQAYLYEEVNMTQQGGTDSSACWIWSEDLNNLQEEYDSGRNLHVRVAVSDIESTARSCETCGTNLIPYPLSTGPKCGDPLYYSFRCNISSAQVSFETPSGTYQVISINPDTRKFVIQTKDADNCKNSSRGKTLLLNQALPFHMTGRCNADLVNSSSELISFKNGDIIEISWMPPLEPSCSSSADCQDWPNSTCNATQEGKNRCICNINFQWDSLKLKCTEGDDYSKETGGRGKMTLALIIGITFTSIIFLIILSSTIVYICLRRRKVVKRQDSGGSIQKNAVLQLYDSERRVKNLIESRRFKEDDAKGIDVPFFDLESILAATAYFSNANKLGQGGFGPVYKGSLPGGQEVAVKRLSSGSGQGLEEFKNEVLLIAKLQHRNLVRLLGYCVEEEEKMLIYEYMANKSLDSFIFDRKLCMLLDWDMRFNIILGISRGLLYLHQDSRLRIIHRDLKTSNILLDEQMNPKISDFGLARIFGGNETAENTKRVVGTYGYMSPEYALDGLFSVKSDVFSFGVVVIEIISGKRNTGFYQPEQALSLLGYALIYEYMANKSLDSFIFDRKLCMLLDWDMRFNIILGISRGLLYLHQDSRLRIIHRDLKTSNILLDEQMNPKISDFGLARIFGGNETAENTKRVVGTYGYMSPEYALDGLFSVKSDVFSFGVVVIEIISGKRNTGFYQPEQALSLLGYAWHLWKEGKALDLMEETVRESCKKEEYLKCITVGLLCVQEDPSDRPTMSHVVFMLGSETATLPTPKQPAFVVKRCPSSRASSSSKPETYSNNELTVTLEDGR